jgi:hypothetical protein
MASFVLKLQPKLIHKIGPIRLTDLQTSVASKLAVATVHAFPLLMRLARTWQGFQGPIL